MERINLDRDVNAGYFSFLYRASSLYYKINNTHKTLSPSGVSMVRKRNSGFSFVEVMISMVVLAFVTLLIGVVLTTSTRTHKTAYLKDEAYAIAREKLAELQDKDTKVPASGDVIISRTNVVYNLNWNITETVNEADKAVITVTWGNNRQVQVTGFIEADIESCPTISGQEDPDDITLSPGKVGKNSPPGSFVGKLETDDPNNEDGDMHTYMLDPPGDVNNDKFAISVNKVVTLVKFTTTDDRNISIKSTDCDGRSITRSFIIKVPEVIGNVGPYDIILTPSDVDENIAAGFQVGVLDAVDPNTGDDHSFQLVAGDGDNDNSSFTINVDKLITNATFNHEAGTTRYIRVKATETGMYKLSCEDVLTITINNTNDAPVIPPAQNLNLTPITTLQVNNAGNLVSDIIAGTITDEDATSVNGIGIYEKSEMGGGTWQYFINGGANWSDFGTFSSKALVLRAVDKVRYNTNELAPTGTPYFKCWAWDQTDGSTEGTKINDDTRGGITALSEDYGIATITVTKINRAPVLTTQSPSHEMPPISFTATGNPGELISDIIGNSIADEDEEDDTGIAIYDADPQNSVWQYSTDGGTLWNNFFTISGTDALLLRTEDWVRFKPDNVSAPGVDPSFSYYAWDRTSGHNPGDKTGVTSRGGQTAFSDNNDGTSIHINPNEAPELDLIGPRSVVAGQTLTIDADADDTEGDQITYSVANEPPGATINSSDGYFQWNSDIGDVGKSYSNVIFTAEDDYGSDWEAITITVGTNNPPDLADPVDLPDEKSGTAFDFTLSAYDPDSDPITFSMSINPSNSNPTLDPNSGYFYWNPIEADVNTYSVTFTATSLGGSDPETMTITIASGGICADIDDWVGSGYEAGSQVQHNGRKYQCKEWPYDGWCNQGGYEPGGPNSDDCWIDLGSCNP